MIYFQRLREEGWLVLLQKKLIMDKKLIVFYELLIDQTKDHDPSPLPVQGWWLASGHPR